MSRWRRGSVVRITDSAHPGAICVLTSATPASTEPWMLVDETCVQWRSEAWVAERYAELLVGEEYRDRQTVQRADRLT